MPLRDPDERDDDPELLDEEDDDELRTVEPELRLDDDEPLLTVVPLLRLVEPELERTELEPLDAAAFTTERITGITRPLSDDRLLLAELLTAFTEDCVERRTASLVSPLRLLELEERTVPLLDEPLLDDPDERTVPLLDEPLLLEPEDLTVPLELPDERVEPDDLTVPLPVERVGDVERTVPVVPDERVVPLVRPTVPVLRLWPAPPVAERTAPGAATAPVTPEPYPS